jgi:hypothetical protein
MRDACSERLFNQLHRQTMRLAGEHACLISVITSFTGGTGMPHIAPLKAAKRRVSVFQAPVKHRWVSCRNVPKDMVNMQLGLPGFPGFPLDSNPVVGCSALGAAPLHAWVSLLSVGPDIHHGLTSGSSYFRKYGLTCHRDLLPLP